MQIVQACASILDQLEDVVNQISEPDFSKPSPALSNSTIGQHIRHTLEFFLCLEKGFQNGLINYDKRAHDQLIETDKFLALSSIQRVRKFVCAARPDHELKLEVGYHRHSEECLTIETNYFRELTYNIEHGVHHMALIKIGIREIAGYVKLPPDFGIAVSTLRHAESVTHPKE